MSRTEHDNSHLQELITLWTIQREAAWSAAQARGVLRADGRRVYQDWRVPYRWLRRRMASRMPDFSGGYPIWAWVRPKPDLRSSAHLPPATRAVRITFRVPVSRVLLLDFHAWHAVLNKWYLSLTEEEDDEWDRTSRQRKAGSQAMRRSLEASWDRVFDLETLDRSPMFGPVRVVQAVIEEVCLGEVVLVENFTAR